MITVGVDAHKSLHVAVAFDGGGREVGTWRGPNSPTGWAGLRAWALPLGEPRVWGIEGAWNYGRGLAQQLVAAGETVYEVNARWTALQRRGARRAGKSDRLDAHAVAQFARREAPRLPRVQADDITATLDLLTRERATAQSDAIRLRNQIHALLLQLDPHYKDHLPDVRTRAWIAAVVEYRAPESGPLPEVRAASVRRLAQRLRQAMDQIRELGQQIRGLTTKAGFAPLTRICGINLLTARTLAGILGPGQRFASDAALAAYAGVAPLEASSADRIRHRLNRGGNRQLNAVLHMIAVTQLRSWPPAQAYVARRVSEGKTQREARRALKRFVIRAIWQAWRLCGTPHLHTQAQVA
jgi:transposase